MDYHTLLKSEEEIKQELEKQKLEHSKIQFEEHARKQWLGLNPTKVFIGQVENLFLEVSINLLDSATNSEINNEQFRLQAVEVQTLRKTLNLLKYGKFNDTGVTDSRVN